MQDTQTCLQSTPTLFVGIDLHLRRWHVTLRTIEAELISLSIDGTWEALLRVLQRFPDHPVEAV